MTSSTCCSDITEFHAGIEVPGSPSRITVLRRVPAMPDMVWGPVSSRGKLVARIGHRPRFPKRFRVIDPGAVVATHAGGHEQFLAFGLLRGELLPGRVERDIAF